MIGGIPSKKLHKYTKYDTTKPLHRPIYMPNRSYTNDYNNFTEQNIFTPTHPDNIDYNLFLNNVLQRICKRDDRFIECPTLISEEVRYKNDTL